MLADLWHGGGQWTLYGLALVLRVKVLIFVVERATLALTGPAKGTELVDARPAVDAAVGDNAADAAGGGDVAGGGCGASRMGVVRLASLRSEDGQYDHFDVLVDAHSADASAELLARAEPLARAVVAAPTPQPEPSARAALVAITSALLWPALCVLALAVLSGGRAPSVATVRAADGGGGWLPLAQTVQAVQAALSTGHGAHRAGSGFAWPHNDSTFSPVAAPLY